MDTIKARHPRECKDKGASAADLSTTGKGNPSLAMPQAKTTESEQARDCRDISEPEPAIFKTGTRGPGRAMLRESKRGPKIAKSGAGRLGSVRVFDIADKVDPGVTKLLASAAESCFRSFLDDGTIPGRTDPLANGIKPACPNLSTGTTGPDLLKLCRNSNDPNLRESDTGGDKPTQLIPQMDMALPNLANVRGNIKLPGRAYVNTERLASARAGDCNSTNASKLASSTADSKEPHRESPEADAAKPGQEMLRKSIGRPKRPAQDTGTLNPRHPELLGSRNGSSLPQRRTDTLRSVQAKL